MKSMSNFLMKMLLLALLLAFPGTALAEALVAVIMPGDLPRYQEAHKAFEQVMNVGGKGKVKLIVKRPNPDQMSLANDIRRLVGAGAKVIVTYGATATMVAQKEAKGVPVIFADVCDPVSLGIVKTLESPGVEMTGAACKTPMSDLIEAMIQIKKPATVGSIFSSDDPASVLQTSGLESLGGQFGFKVVKAEAKRAKDAGNAMKELTGKADAIYVADCSAAQMQAAEIMKIAMDARTPVISQVPGLAEDGALLTLEADPAEQGKLIAVHTLQIVSGQKAHLLPVRTPKKINLVVNKKTAAALGLSIPAAVLSDAGRVIQ